MDNWIPEQQQPENQRSALDFNNGMELDDLFVNYFGFFLSMRTSWNVANRQDVRQSSTHFYFEGLKGGWIFHYGLWLRIRALNLEEKKKKHINWTIKAIHEIFNSSIFNCCVAFIYAAWAHSKLDLNRGRDRDREREMGSNNTNIHNSMIFSLSQSFLFVYVPVVS